MRFSILLTGLLVSTAFGASAQQDAQYTNFMNNKLALNPAVAGSKGVPTVYALVRKQWFGLEGAPASQAAGFHMPLAGKNAGLGFLLLNDEIGFTRATQVGANYAYHVQVGNQTYLSAGISATARQYRIDWTEARATDSGDGNIPDISQSSKMMANFGTGLMLYNERFYVGLSVPRLMRNQLDFGDQLGGATTASREDIHTYLMGGMLFPLTEQLSLKPAVLVKYVPDAPLDVDLHASLVYKKLVSVGATYRTGGSQTAAYGESIDLLASVQATPHFRLGMAYDFTLSEIQTVSNGSAELFVEWTFGQMNKRLTNPRFF